MVYSHEVEHMCVVKKGPNHGPALACVCTQYVTQIFVCKYN